LAPSFKGSIKIPPHTTRYIVSLSRQPLIKWKFLSKALESILKVQSPPTDFTILKQVLPQDLGILWKLLPMVESSSVPQKNLQDECPLTPALLYLCLKYMEHQIQKTGTVLSVSRQRWSILIYMEQEKQHPVDKLLSEIREESGLSWNVI
ncbi:hypothetical protein J4Q44_G00385310, partial [Coregonus suidteri]